MAEHPASTTVHATFDISREPIHGVVTGPEGTQHPFVGWLRLMAVLERLRAG